MARRLPAIARRESEVHPIRAVTARGRRPRRNFRQAVELNSGLIALEEAAMHGIIYIVGLIVVILAILSFFGLR